ncbi:geranyl transferase [Permianibacter sp. IMCC34836]|uniref:polyprenyl synthetase family protein n=1 Tax=Permianibacter fluminis TaxID=2738515 RepID=UPI0015542E70|nr:farnesyl diphosphate synthase [Permianibacter fluminis]NQD36886.1 geranyl transferase [Permianibacter fluminis]
MSSFVEFLDGCQQRVDGALARMLPVAEGPTARLHAAMRYATLNKGKRLRPILVYAAGALRHADAHDLDVAACAVELIHAYSLVHDDLPAMDDDDLRRGQPTTHIAFDEATAILAGDALQTLAFEHLAAAPLSAQSEPIRIQLLQLLAKASGAAGMGGGQAIDLAATGQQLTLAELQHMHALKTGALITASVLMGAACSGPWQPNEWQALTAYGNALGLAFQIHDDVLDIEADTATLGKPQGSDIEKGKMTFPALLGLAEAKRRAQQTAEQAVSALAGLPYHTGRLIELARYVVSRGH